MGGSQSPSPQPPPMKSRPQQQQPATPVAMQRDTPQSDDWNWKRHQSIASQQFLRDLRTAEAHLRARGLERVPIRGDDNNCQFRTLAAFYNHANVTHDAIRQLIVDYILAHAEQFRVDVEIGLGYPSLEQYCAEMRRSGTWGDGVTLMAFALMQNVNIEVCTASGFAELYPGPGRPRMAVVCVGEHYEATRLRPVTGDAEPTPTVV